MKPIKKCLYSVFSLNKQIFIYIAFVLLAITIVHCSKNPVKNDPAEEAEPENLDSLFKVFFSIYDSVTFPYQWENRVYNLLELYVNEHPGTSEYLQQLIWERKNLNYDIDFMYRQLGMKKLEDMDFEEGYRFTMTRAFIPNEIIISVYKYRNKINLDIVDFLISDKHVDSIWMKMFRVEKIVYQASKELSEEQWLQLKQKIEGAYFWSLSPDDGHMGFDGSNWSVQGRRKDFFQTRNQYHYVTRWAPRDGSFKDIGLYMLELSRHDAGKIY